jgi:hypothetical protein
VHTPEDCPGAYPTHVGLSAGQNEEP